MSALIPFDQEKLPAYLQARSTNLNSDMTAHASVSGFPSLSIKGSKFAIVRDGDRNLVMNPKDPESPASYLEVVIIKVNPNKSKIWYAQGYVEGAEATKPDCYSVNGDAPDARSTKPQSKTCALCPHNQWGSRITPDGKKGKSCSDSVRIAIAAPDHINDPMMLRVPPASIKAIGEYGESLKKRRIEYSSLVTRLSFDQSVSTPKLVLKPVGFIDEKTFNEVLEMQESDLVQQIIGDVSAGVADDLPEAPSYARIAAPAEEKFEQVAVEPPLERKKEVTEADVMAVIEKASKPKPKPKAEPAPEVVKPAAVTTSIDDIDLDNLDFDE